jgi:hypothetical protein
MIANSLKISLFLALSIWSLGFCVKKGNNTNYSHSLRPLKNAQFCSRSRKARILNTGIPVVFRELEFGPDAACPAIAFGDGGRLGKRWRFSMISP